MKTVWIIALLVACCGVHAKAQADDEYDNYFNYDDLEDLDKMIDEEINESLNKKTDTENDLKVEEEIQQFRDADGDKLDAVDDLKDIIDNIDDYQFEDNRDKSNEEEGDEKKDFSEDSDGSISDSIEETIAKDLENRPEPDDPNAPSRNEDYALLWGDDSVAPLPVPETVEEDDNKDIIEETKQILAEQDAENFEEDIKKEVEKADVKLEEQPDLELIVEETKQLLAESDDSFNNDKENGEGAVKTALAEQDAENYEEDIKETVEKSDVKPEDQPDLEQILEETKQLLAESDDSFNDDKINQEENVVDPNNGDEEKNVENKVGQEEKEEDTVDKVYEDLNADLDKLFATLDKLANDGSDNKDHDENLDQALEDVDKFFEELDNKDVEGSEEFEENNDDIDLDKLLENILSENDMKVEDAAAELEPLINDALNEPNPDDAIEKDIENLDSNLKPIRYLNDALIDEPKENAETLETSEENNANADEKDASIEKQTFKTAFVDELNSSELEDLVAQFAILHEDELDVHSEDFDKNVAPVHITLKLDEPTVITSPNYPNAYPTGNTVDWILEGPGEGIELNITDFAVNGGVGDYLLIKPGGIDDSSHKGLVFTYRLNSERRYRFTDVDRLFIRFEAERGEMYYKGFSVSAKMIVPLPSEPEPMPEPEPVVTPPHSTATVTVALPTPLFAKVEEDFRLVLADMAEEYINSYDIELGLNTTSEVTQITSFAICPRAWPGYEGCTAVTFGVSLVYEDDDQKPRLDEDDLRTMWTTYVNRDPFAFRLRALGISEFYGPNSAAMTAWLVIAAGVIISMSMLAFVLWRYSCFEGYTRMKAYSDTDSIHNEKRNLDLYPTPHQTLPPLYADTQAHEYKWADDDTRVDMGGFANRSYTQENMYDFESDEEVVTTRDRQGVVTAKDYSSNV